MKRLIGDFLSLIFGGGDEDYEPSRGHYYFFGAVLLIIAFLIWAKTQNISL